MKAVILAGGLGTRLSEETGVRPKPMVEIGGQPILWHLMKIYSAYGIDDFIVCLGYKGEVIKDYFASYCLRSCDLSFDMATGAVQRLSGSLERWRVTLVDTGADTMTGGRLRRVRRFLDDGPFCFTYGDGVADVNIPELLRCHAAGGRLATLTAVQPPGRFGAFALAEHETAIRTFTEKPQGDGAWINGGFFVLEPGAIDYVDGDADSWEQGPLNRLANAGQLQAYRHDGFWQPMDTLHDKNVLTKLWDTGQAPWKVWDREPQRRATPILRAVV